MEKIFIQVKNLVLVDLGTNVKIVAILMLETIKLSRQGLYIIKMGQKEEVLILL